MKTSNIKFSVETIFSSGKRKYNYFATEVAARNFANRQFRKDEDVTVVIYQGFGFNRKYCTYHA